MVDAAMPIGATEVECQKTKYSGTADVLFSSVEGGSATMKCENARERLFSKLDGELSDSENLELDEHLAQCEICRREFSMVTLAPKMAGAVPPIKSSPFFYRKLQARIDEEVRGAANLQIFWGLAGKMIPALAGVTLLLLSVFFYLQMNAPEAEFYQAYEGIYILDDQSHRILAAEQNDITYESVLTAIAERALPRH
jgi:anti-sigma factor RsiW